MTACKAKTVWIIGAGFSRHAGGPLMDELFSETSDHLLDMDDLNYQLVLQRVGRLYRSYLQGGEAKKTLWLNAEHFLERLDDLAERKRPAILILELVNFFEHHFVTSIEHVRWFASTRLCKEVNDYVNQVRDYSERLTPYRHWVSKLTASDTIVSFNYDGLVEKAAAIAKQCVKCPLPNDQTDPDSPNLLKLHGSVEWAITHNGSIAKRSNYDDFHGLARETRPLIATPGASKGRFVRDFSTHWAYAVDAIRNAEYVHIVGYRFPESDSEAVLRLLNALRTAKQGIKVNIVLGSDETRPEVKRLKQLVECNVGQSGSVVVRPMFAQDYLTLDDSWVDPDIGALYIS